MGGLLLAATNTGTVFAATCGTLVWSALLVSQLRPRERPEPAPEHRGGFAEAVEGFRVLGREPSARVIVSLYSCQTLVDGALRVLMVVTALDLLGIGKSGLGFLNAAVGVGGLVGVAFTFALVGRNRLAGDFGLGLLMMGLALGLIGVFPKTVAAIVLMGVLGVGNTIVDVSAVTLMQRAVRDEVLGRVFGSRLPRHHRRAAAGGHGAPLEAASRDRLERARSDRVDRAAARESDLRAAAAAGGRASRRETDPAHGPRGRDCVPPGRRR